MWEGCGVVSDCEELVGVTWSVSDLKRFSGGYSQEMMGLVFRVLFFVGNKPEIIRCARSPRSPIDTIRRGHDGS